MDPNTDPTILELIMRSKEMLEKAYCPYSNFAVGAALLCEDGTIYTGCNVENASYGLSICAERTALVKAVSEGRRSFKAIAITLTNDYGRPCGACRQFMVEFGVDWDVYMTNCQGQYIKLTTGELLPQCFTSTNLNI